MQRPSLNPVLVQELDAPRRHVLEHLRVVGRQLRLAMLPVRWLVFVLLTDLADPLHHRTAEPGHWRFARWVRGAFVRLSLVPIFTLVVAASLVFTALHPPAVEGVLTPARQGLWFTDATLKTNDGQSLAAWVVPVLNEQRVLAEGDRVLRDRSPAVVLVHDANGNRGQMLPMVRLFHDAGFVVVVPATRGCDSNAWATQTFGIREALDVAAAVERARNEPLVDASRVAIVGVGAGATAAVLAAANDPGIAALVLHRPAGSSATLLRERVGPTHARLAGLDVVCGWLMDVIYGLDLRQLDELPATLHHLPQPVLTLDPAGARPDWSEAVRFLDSQLEPTVARTLGR